MVMTAHMAAMAAQAPTKPTPPVRTNGNGNMVSLGFTNTDIHTFAGQMAERLGLTPMIVDSAVQGTVDFNFPIPQEDLFDLFNWILKSRNAALVREESIYQIVPISQAIRNNLEIIDEQPAPTAGKPSAKVLPAQPAPGRRPEEPRAIPVATHVVHLDFVPVDDVLEAVRLFISDGVPIITYRRLNLMIITDYSDNAARVREFVRMLDNSFLDPGLVELVIIKNGNAVDIAEELKKIFASSATDNAATGISFLPFERLNAIFVTAGTRRGLDTAKRWIEELDTYTGGKFQTFIYTVKESTASNIAQLLLALYGEAGATSATTGSSARNNQGTTGSSSLLSRALGAGNDGVFGSATQLGPRLNTSSSGVTSIILPGGGAFSSLRDEARVVVDEINNVLHIQSTPADYRFLLNDIEKMDLAPRQVMIELEIFQVDLTGDLTYGFSGVLQALQQGNMTTAGLGSGDNNGLLSVSTFTNIGRRQIILTLDALRSKTNVKTLQNPRLLAMDGTPAYFNSGAEVPYPSESIYSGNYTSTGMSYRTTGVNLQVTPRISASGMVMMDIVQEVSTVSERTVAGLSAPIFPVNQVQTTLSVRDGETVAIAGLISDSDKWGRVGVPFLSDIPIVGNLFGATSRGNTRTEMIVLITPHVIRTQEQFQDITQGLRDSLRNVRRYADDYDDKLIRDIEDARIDREKRELERIKEIKPAK